MKKLFILIFLSSSLLFTDCGSDIEESNLTLNFQLEYDGSAVFSGQEIDHGLGYEVFFSKYSFFLSELTLNSSEGNHVLSEIEFVDLLNGIGDEAAAKAGTNLTFDAVPAREYTSLSFNIGLPEAVNATSPNEYDSSSPLANTGEYWAGWSSYIFHKIEGKIDDPADPKSFETGLALHIGSNAAFREVTINTPITLDNEEETMALVVDIKKALTTNTGLYDLLARPQVHHEGVLPEVLPILDATLESIIIRQ